MNEPFFKSYLLGRNFLLEDIKTLSNTELDTLNIETMAALEDCGLFPGCHQVGAGRQ